MPKPWKNRLMRGDARKILPRFASESVQCVITSPPYYGLRDYGVPGQIGLEDELEKYIASLAAVFEECRRVVKSDGVMWVVVGDSYAGGGRAGKNPEYHARHKMFGKAGWDASKFGLPLPIPEGCKRKDLIGIPWLVAFALRGLGWYWRSIVIWDKGGGKPERVDDRPTNSHEYLLLFAKSELYKHNQLTEPANAGGERNIRSVWHYPVSKGTAGLAPYPEDLIEPLIRFATDQGDVVLDPFLGSGTTAAVARKMHRRYVGIELSPEEYQRAVERVQGVVVG